MSHTSRGTLRRLNRVSSRFVHAVTDQHYGRVLVALGATAALLMLWDLTTLSSRLNREYAVRESAGSTAALRSILHGATLPGSGDRSVRIVSEDDAETRLPATAFEREALQRFRQNAQDRYIEIDSESGGEVVRYALADQRDGVLSAIVLTRPVGTGSAALGRTAVVSLIVIGLGVAALSLVLYKNRRTARDLELKVLERTEALTAQTAELQAAEEKYRCLADASVLSVYIIQDMRYVYVNRQMANLLGSTAGELLRAPSCLQFVAESARAEVEARIQSRIAGGDAHIEYATTLQRVDGTVRHVRVYGARIEYQGRPAAMGSLIDVTEQHFLEQQVQQQNKLEAVGQLAAGIAHEINTPTQFVGDNLRFCQQACADMAPVLERLSALAPEASSETVAHLCRTVAAADLEFIRAEMPAAIQQSLDGIARVSAIVQAMKEFSHPGTGVKQATDLNHAIRTTLTVARNEWKYVATVSEDLDPTLPLVPCLPGEINQVLLNVMVNAAHAIAAQEAKEPGVITVRTRLQSAHVEVRIHDTGIGIPKDTQARIFEPFFTTKSVGRGTGQGLALAHRVVTKRHGGTLAVESEVGQGTTIILRLPLDPERAVQPPGRDVNEADERPGLAQPAANAPAAA